METEALILILARHQRGELVLISSHSLVAENRQNPVADRRDAVARLLDEVELPIIGRNEVRRRTLELDAMGIAGFDAVHLACAECSQADYFITTDDRLLKKAWRLTTPLSLQAMTPVRFMEEVI